MKGEDMDAQRVHEELKGLAEDVADIKRAVVGEPKFGQEGLVKKVARLERQQTSLMLKAAAMAGAMGGVVSGVAKLVEHLAK